jgi:hypothetical protein
MSIFPRDLDQFLRRCEIDPELALDQLEAKLERAIRAHRALWAEETDHVGVAVSLIEPEEITFCGYPHLAPALACFLAWLHADRRLRHRRII